MAKKQEIQFTEAQLLDLYGLYFKMAHVDGELDKDELRRLFEIINTEAFSKEGKSTIQNYLVAEPSIEEIIKCVKADIDDIRYIAYLNCLEISICNDEVHTSQQELLMRLKKEFMITDKQDEEMWKFAQTSKRLTDRGIDDKYATDALKSGIAGLGAVGVPVAAVYFSGSVIGLSAAGITSGLAALGLGFGMIPGIGVAIVIGAAIFITLTKVFDVGGTRKKKKIQIEKERRAEQVIRNLQETINSLIDRIADLEEKAKDAEANKEAIQKLQEILQMLRQIQNSKKQVISSC